MIYAGQIFGAGGFKTVQRGTAAMGEDVQTVNVTIAAVNPAKAFVLITLRCPASSPQPHSATADLINGTTLRLQRDFHVNLYSYSAANIVWQVIEFL